MTEQRPRRGHGDWYRWVAVAEIAVFLSIGIGGVAAGNRGAAYVGFALAALAILFWFLRQVRNRLIARERRRFPPVGLREGGGNWRQRYRANWAADRYPPSRWRRYGLVFTLVTAAYLAVPSGPLWLRALGGVFFGGIAVICFVQSLHRNPE